MAKRITPFQRKRQLVERWRELEFVDDVQDLKCSRCNRLALEHWYTNCGHALCPHCKRLLSGGGFKCPQCDQLIQHIKDQSADLEEKVKGRHVKCPNYRLGCSLITTVSQLLEHFTSCKWTKMQALPIEYSGTTIGHIWLKESRLKESSSKEQMDEMNEPIEFLKNAFQRGKAIVQLLNGKSNIQLLIDSFLFGSEEEQMAFESVCLKWTIKHFEQLIPNTGTFECMCDILPVYGYQLKAQLRLTINSKGTVELRICFKDEEREGQKVDIKFLPIVSFIIKDLNGQNKHFITHCYSSFNKTLEYNLFDYRSNWIPKSEWNTLVSLCDESMKVLVLVEPPTINIKPLSADGTITDTIQHYSRKLQMEKEGLNGGQLSPPFLTHGCGFRVQVWMWLNGDIGKNKKGLKAWISFLSGEFDSELGVEFEHETRFTLINQLDGKKNITIKNQAKDVDVHKMEIASEEDISSGGFIVNDSLTYCVTIIRLLEKS